MILCIIGDSLGFSHPVNSPNVNDSSYNGTGITSFAHAVNGSLSCPSNLTLNGLNGNINNNGLHANQNHQHNGNHSSMNSCSNSSDRCSSSGVSSFDSSESHSQRPLILPQSFASDDSNHSCHSGGMLVHGSNPSHHYLHHNPRPPTSYKNYKFKSFIKQRFSADQRVKTCSSPTPPSSNGSSSESSPKHSHHGVPIFALHDNGGFYVPLTVEASLLRSQMGCTSGDLGSEASLHPVTISVNFSHPSQAIWNPQHSPPHQM